MRFWVLGPLRVTSGGVEVPLGGTKITTVLAALLLSANRPVSVTQLADRLWDTDLPADPRRAVQVYVLRLRRALGEHGACVRTVAGGYEIRLGPGELDASQFDALVAEAEVADLPKRGALLRTALDLWRGPVCADVPSEFLHARDVPIVMERRLVAEERWIDAELCQGRHDRVLADLWRLTTEYPLRERYWTRLILALYRSGRQAEAMEAYWSVRRVLAEEIGVDPSPELHDLYQAMLAADPHLDLTLGQPSQEHRWVTACQLPAGISDFVGRESVRAALTVELRAALEADMPVTILAGSPGTGKTTLAIAFAHSVRALFPDGVWWVALNGASSSPRDPGDVLGDLLEASGVAVATIPFGLDQRAAALRARLADKRVLMVLDDAATAPQVIPLLPGTPGNAVLITSRHDLPGLVVRHSAKLVKVDCLEPEATRTLLSRVLGPAVLAGNPQAAGELGALCGHLPLALRIAASNIRTRPFEGINGYLERLRADRRLDALTVDGAPDIAVRAAFDLSYAQLEPGARRTFALLGLIPGPDFTAEAVAALTDTDVRDAGSVLAVLETANLVQCRAGRFHMHDLLRLYARERARTEPHGGVAWRRLCAWYQEGVEAAVRFEFTYPDRIHTPESVADWLTDSAQARGWLDGERTNLVAIVLRAAEIGPHHLAWQLLDALYRYLADNVHLADWLAVARAGRDGARADGHEVAEAMANTMIGLHHLTLGDLEGALVAGEAARDLYRKVGDRAGEAAVLRHLAHIHDDRGDASTAMGLLDTSAELLRDRDLPEQLARVLLNRAGMGLGLGLLPQALAGIRQARTVRVPTEGDVLYTIMYFYRGSAHRLLGRLTEASNDLAEARRTAIDRHLPGIHQELARLTADQGLVEEAAFHGTEALRLSRGADRSWLEAESLTALAYARNRAGQHEAARYLYDQSLLLSRTHGYRAIEAESLLGLAESQIHIGVPDAAGNAIEALTLSRHLQRPIVECRSHRVLAVIHGATGDEQAVRYHLASSRKIEQATGYAVRNPRLRPTQ